MRNLKMSMRLFLNLTAALLVCIFLLIEVYASFRVFMNIVNRKTDDIYQKDLKQVTERISFEFRMIENLISSIVQKNEQEHFCSSFFQEQDMYLKMQQQKNISSDLMERTIGFKINGFEIFFEDGSTLMENNKIKIEDYAKGYNELQSMIEKSGRKSVLLTSGKGIKQGGDPGRYIFAALLTEQNKTTGILVLQLNSTWMNGLISTDRGAMLLDRKNQAVLSGFYNSKLFAEKNIFANIDEEAGNFQINDGKVNWRIYYENIKGVDLTVAIARDASELFSTIRDLLKPVLLFSVLGCFASFGIGSMLVGKTTKPIYALLERVKKFGRETPETIEQERNASNSMRNMVLLFYITTILIPMLIYIITFYFGATDKIQYIVKNSLRQEVVKTENDISDYLNVNEGASVDIVVDSSLQRFLSGRTDNPEPVSLNEMEMLEKLVKKNMTFINNTTSIEIFDRNGDRVYASDNLESNIKMDWMYFKMTENSHGEAIWNYTDIDRNNKRSLCMVRRIYEMRVGQIPFKTIGYLKLNIPESEIRSLYSKFSYDNSDFFVLDKKGRYASSLIDTRIGEISRYTDVYKYVGNDSSRIVRDGKTYDIIAAGGKRLPLVFMGIIPHDIIIKDNYLIISSSLYMILTICIVLFILSYFLSLFFTKAFNNMTFKLNRFFKGDFQVDFLSNFYFSEIEQLAATFNNMSLRINDLTENLYSEHLKAKEMEKEKKESEIIALQTQINPHFLYNTFESIKWMIKCDKDSAELMLTKLGELFRLGISNKATLVTVSEEIRYANIYVDIQRVRYQDKVKIIWEIADQILEYKIPKFTLQPLIENVYRHGFHSRKENCLLRICGYYEDEYVVFSIIDNGEGIPRERLQEIGKQLEGDLPGESVGIFNVQKRLRIYYGKKAGLSLISHPGVSTIVRVRIPFEEKYNEGGEISTVSLKRF